ncbi:hypothetical protein PORY_000305 [Pneumocystis oryctolagi]|uniref:Uncharacterized protein n=1 Tax=Pneumocystis oryctolagi TaxID=42067 RepID=A0ACB7CEW0_9ASCO|nr:hypothetical protein PORY_000305 [Pneumocystis oryctolagi]
MNTGFINDSINYLGNVSGSLCSSGKHETLNKQEVIHIEDIKAFRRWTIIYPIYFDSKRSIKTGRKVPINMAIIDPLAKTIADGAKALGFSCVFEPDKTHPKDWTNPGRVRIFFKENGIPVHKFLKTKKALYHAISRYLQENPITDVTSTDIFMPGCDKPFSLPDSPKGVIMGQVLPLNSPALVNDELLEKMFKDITKGQKQDIEQTKQKKEKKRK